MDFDEYRLSFSEVSKSNANDGSASFAKVTFEKPKVILDDLMGYLRSLHYEKVNR